MVCGDDVEQLRAWAASLLLYQSVLTAPAGQAFVALLDAIARHGATGDRCDRIAALAQYGRWFHALAGAQQTWFQFLTQQVLEAENPFTQAAQTTAPADISPLLLQAAQHDLTLLQKLGQQGSTVMVAWVQETVPDSPIHGVTDLAAPLTKVGLPFLQTPNWAGGLPELMTYYRTAGVGLFAQFRAFRWQSGTLVGIPHPDPVGMAELVGYEHQRDLLKQNTEALLAGYPALHVLLYGSRGSGKSALIKSLLGEYGDRGLRLLELGKADLLHLPLIVDRLRASPHKFVIFVDDLSFEEDEDTYKALKVVLEGNLTARPANVVVYATSNRRHMIREFFGDRPRPSAGDEVHAWDTVQEKLSLSDRFGLTLTFEPANQETYLKIVHHLAERAQLCLSPDMLDFRALQWATQHNGRSGRTARQFVDFLRAELLRQ